MRPDMAKEAKMISDIHDEIAKGIEYSKESWRSAWVKCNQAIFRGKHRDHSLSYVKGFWQCDCDAWARQANNPGGAWCRHVIAFERIVGLGPYAAEAHQDLVTHQIADGMSSCVYSLTSPTVELSAEPIYTK